MNAGIRWAASLLVLMIGVVLSGAAPTRGAVPSRRYALIVLAGNLPAAENDLRLVLAGLNRKGFVRGDIQVLQGPQATHAHVREALGVLQVRAEKGDEVLVYLDTHGTLAPNPAGPPVPALQLYGGYLWCSELSRWVRAFVPNGVKPTVVIDACYAASLSKSVGPFTAKSVRWEDIAPRNTVVPPADSATKGGENLPYVRWAASGTDQPAWSVRLPNGRTVSAFTSAFFEALALEPDVTCDSMLQRVRARVAQLTHKAPTVQTPQLDGAYGPRSAVLGGQEAHPAAGPLRVRVQQGPGAANLAPYLTGLPGVELVTRKQAGSDDLVFSVTGAGSSAAASVERAGRPGAGRIHASTEQELGAGARSIVEAELLIREFQDQMRAAPSFGLELQTVRSRYRLGEEIELTLRCEHDAFLTVLCFNSEGGVTTLFPNPYTPERRIQAGRPLRIGDDRWLVRAQEPAGGDMLVAIASEQPLELAELEPGALAAKGGFFHVKASKAGEWVQRIRRSLKMPVGAPVKGAGAEGRAQVGQRWAVSLQPLETVAR